MKIINCFHFTAPLFHGNLPIHMVLRLFSG